MKFSHSHYTNAALKYCPPKTRILFVAEAPPLDIDRYFYFEDVKIHDWLWIALMKKIFQAEWRSTAQERKIKREWLSRFQREGYQLIDAVKRPINGSSSERIGLIEADASKLTSEIKVIKPERIILIKATVHKALAIRLEQEKLRVMNKYPLPFPCCGRQTEFHAMLKREWLTK